MPGLSTIDSSSRWRSVLVRRDSTNILKRMADRSPRGSGGTVSSARRPLPQLDRETPMGKRDTTISLEEFGMFVGRACGICVALIFTGCSGKSTSAETDGGSSDASSVLASIVVSGLQADPSVMLSDGT